MFKGASNNTQVRERRKAEDSRANTGGLDETVFKETENPRAQLILKKNGLQEKSSALSAQIKLAKRRYTFRESGTVPLRTIERWEVERQGICAQLSSIDKRLTEMKVDHSVKVQRASDGFAETFKEVAREMLADAVFQRLIIATIHRCGEREEVEQFEMKTVWP